MERNSGSQFIMSFLFIFFPTSGATSPATACSIVLGHDGGTNALHFFVFFFDLLGICLRVGIQPRLAIFQCVHDLLFLLGIELLTQPFVFSRAFDCRTHGMNVPIKCIFCVDTAFTFLSSSANCSASLIIFSICSSVRRPLSFVIVIFSDFPVPLSSAPTLRMPLESISNVTSIWGCPRGAGGIPPSSNLPSRWLSFVIGRSPSKTWMFTAGWLSW